VVFECHKELAIHSLEHMLKQGKLSFASAERMERCLGLLPGSVSPLGLIHDPYTEELTKEHFPNGHRVRLFLDKDLQLKRYVQVKLGNRPIKFLNELEYIDGKIWANVYTSDEIVIINPKTGYVEGIIDCKDLLPQELRTYDTDVLNGIACNPQDAKIYLTGKNWPKLYEIRLVPTN
jgi:hypothetical protein